ncbi:glycosyltransferase family 2 protein [Legionella sp. PATHC035]|uniref:glycosyltransferase family 2 protein n=1 Tax=Legionella sp. PATHC035 TaxID=2992040 RepID=UPI002244CF90|nr:glycosyltransferase family 2 protein [Legionella sp. PATHC035]MCW8409253.1 glycosyltransferase family 2 protein [Legionella sp. PATHC035]
MTDIKPKEGYEWEKLLTIIIPAYNEEEGIKATLESLRTNLPYVNIIVVDDHSSDATLHQALQAPNVRVVTHSYNIGYGGALKTGMALADTEYVAWFDADGEHRIEDLIGMANKIHTEGLLAVIGQRPSGTSSRIRTLGKFLIRMIVRTMKVNAGHDLNCGLRVFRREVICRYLFVLPDGYSASLTSLMIFLERDYPMAFYPIKVNSRIGTSKVKLRDGFNTMALVIRITTLFAPLKIFLRAGVIIFLLGVFYSLYKAIQLGVGFPVAGAISILGGILLMAVGLLADQISQLRLIQLSSITNMPFRPIKSDILTNG